MYGDPHPLYGREGRRSPAVEVAEMVAQMTSSEWRRTLAQEVTEMVWEVKLFPQFYVDVSD